MQEAMFKRCAFYLDIIGELEPTLEGTSCDALMQDFALFLLGLFLFLAADQERGLLRLDRELGLGESGNGHANAIGVVAGSFDIVGRVTRGGVQTRDLIEQRKQAIEAD